MRINPSAVLIWIFAGIVAYLIWGTLKAALLAVAILMAIGFILCIFD